MLGSSNTPGWKNMSRSENIPKSIPEKVLSLGAVLVLSVLRSARSTTCSTYLAALARISIACITVWLVQSAGFMPVSLAIKLKLAAMSQGKKLAERFDSTMTVIAMPQYLIAGDRSTAGTEGAVVVPGASRQTLARLRRVTAEWARIM